MTDIVPFRPEHCSAFYTLNHEWLVGNGLYEHVDDIQLNDPQSTIIDVGGAERVTLVSNSRLQTAVRMYESMGFVHIPIPAGVPYQSADVSMQLEL